jgi:hypothetical protein
MRLLLCRSSVDTLPWSLGNTSGFRSIIPSNRDMKSSCIGKLLGIEDRLEELYFQLSIT